MRWADLGRLTVAICLVAGFGRIAPVRAESSPPSLGVLRDDGQGVSPDLAAAVDEALLRALAAVPDHGQPTLLPAPLLDVQLTVGCEGLGAECMASMADAAGVDAVLVRRLRAGAQGGTALELALGAVGSASVRTESSELAARAGTDALTQEVEQVVRRLFGLPEPEREQGSAGGPADGGAHADGLPPPQAATPAAPPPPSHDAPPAPAGAIGAATWIVLGGGLAVLSGGVAVGLVADGKFEDAKDTAVETRADAERVRADHDSAQSLGNVANVLFAVGGAALATGAVLLALDLGDDASGERPVAHRLRLVPAAGGALLVLDGRLGGAR